VSQKIDNSGYFESHCYARLILAIAKLLVSCRPIT